MNPQPSPYQTSLLASSPSKLRTMPHRRHRPGYKSPSTKRHSHNRRMLFNNLHILNEFYGMDTTQVQFVIQDHYFKFYEFDEYGETFWKKIDLKKRQIVWINPNNGYAIAALRDLEYEIDLPNQLPSYEENLSKFKLLWSSLDYDVNLLYKNIESHVATDEYCCLDCHFPFATVCSELYTRFAPSNGP